MATIFITENYLKSVTSIPANMPFTMLISHIAQAQDKDLQPILGSQFLKSLTDAVAAGTVSADQQALITVIQPFVAQMAYYYIYPHIWAQTTVIGVVNKTGQNSQPVSEKAMQALRQEIRQTADFYAQRIQEFLELPENVTKPAYALYWTYNKPMYPNRGSKYFCGIQTGWNPPVSYGRTNGLDDPDIDYTKRP